VITYEDYFPYGSTSYQAVRGQAAPPKRYRFLSRERDEESGLAYLGARYYALWLGRWTSPDPARLVDAGNRYAYARNDPVGLSDPKGLDPPDSPPVSPGGRVIALGRTTVTLPDGREFPFFESVLTTLRATRGCGQSPSVTC